MNDNIRTVEAIYDAFGRGDVGFIVDQLTDDVDWASAAESSAAPWYGVRHGKAEVPEFFKDWVARSASPSSLHCRSHPTTPMSWRSSTSP